MRILLELQRSLFFNGEILLFCEFFFPETIFFFHCKTCVYTKKKMATFAKLNIEENTLSHLKPYPFFSPTSVAAKEKPNLNDLNNFTENTEAPDFSVLL